MLRSLSLLWVGGCLASFETVAAPADLVIHASRIHTVDALTPKARSFAVREGKFIAVGAESDMKVHIGAQTRIVTFADKVIVPGFVDGHLHPRPVYSEDAPWAVLDAGPKRNPTIDALIANLRRKAAITPPGQWISARGYQETKLGRHPTKADLDAASTDHPILVTHSSGHQSVVNSLALSLGNITRDTPDPAGGHIVKDDQGEPTGRLQESARRLLQGPGIVREVRAPESAQREGYRATFASYAGVGITSVAIAGGSPASADLIESALGAEPGVRVHQMLSDSYIDEAVKRMQATTEHSRITYGSIKTMHGNSLSGQTCWLYEPYANRPDYFGVPPARSQEQLDELVLRIHRAGLQACIHSNGDREIDMVLTAFERAQSAFPRPDARHRIEHCSVVNARIVRRIADGHVVPVLHAYLWEHGDKHEAYGEKRWEWMHAARSMLDAGIPVASHSDAPVSEANPLLRIQEMVTRTSAEGRVYGPTQRITPAEALRVWTLHGAYALHRDAERGSITPGKVADFVVLGGDLETVPVATIKDIPVEQTWVGGERIH